MIRFSRSHIQPIGLDIGHDSIKMMQIETVGSNIAVTAAAQRTFPPAARTDPAARLSYAADMVRQMLRLAPFHGRRVVAALPREVVHIKNLRLPQMPAAELPSIVKFEARNLFSFDTEDCQLQFIPAGEVRQGGDSRQEVIVVAARNSDINSFLEQLHRCGVVVEGLDIEPCALYRGIDRFIRRREDEQDVNVLVDVGSIRSQVVIGKGRDINFIKQIEIGGLQLDQAVARKLGIPVDEAQALRRRLVETNEANDKRDPVRQAVYDASRGALEELGREISLCLRYHSVTFRGHRPTRLRIVGGESCDPQLQAMLSVPLTIPVEVARPLYSVNTSKMNLNDRRGTMCQWAVAFGLGLKLTTSYFGARDGKPRDPHAPATPPPASTEPAGEPAPAPAVRPESGAGRLTGIHERMRRAADTTPRPAPLQSAAAGTAPQEGNHA